jgi:hypothetical protein
MSLILSSKCRALTLDVDMILVTMFVTSISGHDLQYFDWESENPTKGPGQSD